MIPLTFTRCAASHVGRQHIGQQRVLLARWCTNRGTILHHIGHVLGLVHENSRQDRDQYISIDRERMRPGETGSHRKWTEMDQNFKM